MMGTVLSTDEKPAEKTRLFAELSETPKVIAQQEVQLGRTCKDVGDRLRGAAPKLVLTIGRGSSDHAATYAKYLIETRLGIPVASFAPSVRSLYGAKPDLREAVCFVISQSGASPDILAAVEGVKAGGAEIIALINVVDSPLAQMADWIVPLCAEPEVSIAASKSCLASFAALARLVAAWEQDAVLQRALKDLPDLLGQAQELDWSAVEDVLSNAAGLFVAGRGIGLAAAQEAALKFKETCGLHAEAISLAEIFHGPAAIIQDGFPALIFVQADATRVASLEAARKLTSIGARVLIAGADINEEHTDHLPTVDGHPALVPIAQLQSFYRMVNALAVARARNPDYPPHLSKVTETL